MSDNVVVSEWPRNAREVIRVSVSTFNGRRVVDVRTWYPDGSGNMKPGRSGITLGVDHVPKLADAFAKASTIEHDRAGE